VILYAKATHLHYFAKIEKTDKKKQQPDEVVCKMRILQTTCDNSGYSPDLYCQFIISGKIFFWKFKHLLVLFITFADKPQKQDGKLYSIGTQISPRHL